jgi:dTMP kinase
MPAPYVIFEGNDGTGKSTLMKGVADRLKLTFPTFDPLLTQHPGSTPLGRHLRQLVKYPHQIAADIVIDDLSRQVLYMVDTISYVRTLLEPSLAAGKPVFADRSSFISAIVYGMADGLRLDDIGRILELITPPKADRLYVLQCPNCANRERIGARHDLDHYDLKPVEFSHKIDRIYSSLLTTSAAQTMLVSRCVAVSDVVYVDAGRPLQEVIDIVTADAADMIRDRYH